jgi:AMP-binding enzyme C-terminal domain
MLSNRLSDQAANGALERSFCVLAITEQRGTSERPPRTGQARTTGRSEPKARGTSHEASTVFGSRNLHSPAAEVAVFGVPHPLWVEVVVTVVVPKPGATRTEEAVITRGCLPTVGHLTMSTIPDMAISATLSSARVGQPANCEACLPVRASYEVAHSVASAPLLRDCLLFKASRRIRYPAAGPCSGPTLGNMASPILVPSQPPAR